jgi:peptidoglycan/xylan/chitin deacetylase (PgdA/CDA1 family)
VISERYRGTGAARTKIVVHTGHRAGRPVRLSTGDVDAAVDLGNVPWGELALPEQRVLASFDGLPVVVEAGGLVHVGFDWWAWEGSVLAETGLSMLQPAYSSGRIPYTRIPFETRARLNRVRIALLHARQRHITFPADPVDTTVDVLRDVILGSACSLAGVTLPEPGRDVILTHDLDEDFGVPGIEKLRAVERDLGVVSAFGVLSQRYRVEEDVLLALLAEGCEVFSHGYLHDGTIAFLEPEEIRRRLRHFFTTYPSLAGRVRGFRSGQLVRSPALFEAVAEVFDYDMTPPNVELGGPQGWRTGCATTIPFARDNGLLHIPLTVPQDYFLAFVRRRSAAEIARTWLDTTEAVWRVGGTAVHLVHPDNVLRRPALLTAYRAYLEGVLARGGRVILPGEIAERWPRASRTAA